MKNIVFILVIAFLCSCGSSVKNQTAAWASNQAKIKEYSLTYPYLADKINAQNEIAKKAMENTNGITDEKTKIKAMQAANSLCTEGAIAEVVKLESAIQSVKQKVRMIRDDFKPAEFSQKTTFILTEATNSLDRTNLAITRKYNSADSALLVFQREARNLNEIQISLQNHYTEVVRNRPAQSTVAKKDTVTATPGKPQVAMIKCKYCGGKMNTGDKTCKNCGAPVK